MTTPTTDVEHLNTSFISATVLHQPTYQSLDKLSEINRADSAGSVEGRRGCPRRCCLPRRYLLVAMGALGVLLTVGTRAFFALVVTHVLARNGTSTVVIFSNCTSPHSSIDTKLSLSGENMFILHTVYFIGYFLMCVPGSVICTWMSSVRLLGAMMVANSTITLLLPTIMEVSTPLLFVARLLQGLTEGCQQPVLIGLIAVWSTQQTRASMTAVLISDKIQTSYGAHGFALGGLYISPAVAFVFTSVCLCFVSWDSIFYIYGAAGILWSIAWLRHFHDTPEQHPDLSPTERQYHATHGHTVKSNSVALLKSIPWLAMLKSPSVWCLGLASFGRNFVLSALVVEQPQYFHDSFDMNTSDIGMLATAVHVGLTFTCVVGGSISDLLLRYGVRITLVRKLVMTIGSLMEGGCLLALCFINDWKTAFLVLGLGVSFGGISIPGYLSLAGDLAPQFAGVITGVSQIGTTGAILSTVIASTLTGGVQTIESWQKFFLLAGCVVLVIMICFDIFVDARQQPWASGNAYKSNNHTTTVAAAGRDAETTTVTADGHSRKVWRNKQTKKTSPARPAFSTLFGRRRRESRTSRISKESEETVLFTKSLGEGDEDAFSEAATAGGGLRAGYGAIGSAAREEGCIVTVVSDIHPKQHLSLLGL